jgi:hypothetical protein
VAFILGIVALGLLWWAGKNYAKANPAQLAKWTRQAGGIAAFAVAGFLLLRGRVDVAVALGGAGAWLLGLRGFAIPGFSQRTSPTPGASSRVRSAVLDMNLDHDSGALTGQVLAGPYEGRSLDDLGEAEIGEIAALCRASDPDGLRLLEAYLDRRFPRWRETAQGDAHAGAGDGAAAGGGARSTGMTEQEAYEVLGLRPGAGEEEIRGAHRALMKKLHPDQGGSTYLATRVNQAKDVLLSRHR